MSDWSYFLLVLLLTGCGESADTVRRREAAHAVCERSGAKLVNVERVAGALVIECRHTFNAVDLIAMPAEAEETTP